MPFQFNNQVVEIQREFVHVAVFARQLKVLVVIWKQDRMTPVALLSSLSGSNAMTALMSNAGPPPALDIQLNGHAAQGY